MVNKKYKFLFLFVTIFAVIILASLSVVSANTYNFWWESPAHSWKSATYSVSSDTCGHGVGCICGGHNYCGTYKPGESTYYWQYNGCYDSIPSYDRWTIICHTELTCSSNTGCARNTCIGQTCSDGC